MVILAPGVQTAMPLLPLEVEVAHLEEQCVNPEDDREKDLAPGVVGAVEARDLARLTLSNRRHRRQKILRD